VRVSWLASARANLIAIAEHIAHDNPAAAYAVHEAILRHAGRLATHPRLGRAGRITGTRELVVPGTPYIVAYRVAAQEIVILRVLHGARRWPTQLG
jgi:toxin ParE1/3/4